MNHDDIHSIVCGKLKRIEELLSSSKFSNSPKINELVNKTVASGGKRVRPLFLLLSAGVLGYEGDMTVPLGVIIEKVHTASLLHDDVIDEASVRRGSPSANSLFGNTVSVLAGDCLYTAAFLELLDYEDLDFARLIMRGVTDMSAGEVLQMTRRWDLKIAFEDYLKIIHGKTAALFSAACGCGAVLGDKSKLDSLTSLGLNLGYAFQLQDDLLDYYGDEKTLGKTPGADLAEGRVTLPLILLLKAAPTERRIAELFNGKTDNETKLRELVSLFEKYGIKEKAEEIITGYLNAAFKVLESLPRSKYYEALHFFTEKLARRSR